MILIFLVSLLTSSFAHADYASELAAAAAAKNLHAHPYWLKLLHVGASAESGFYNSPRGADDPAAEMTATIKAFFDPVEPDEISENPAIDPRAERQHAQCRFAARYAWLSERLDFDESKLPRPSCKRYRQWRKSLDPDSVSLVFASYYLSNPASMFGHTLLKLNKKAHSKTEILDYGVNYAATVTTSNGFAYAILGMFGGFRGSFTNFPYYMKVRQYGNFESRDLWEYELNLNQKARDRLMAHLWELGHTSFPYYFFKANCSYLVLKLLEVAEPALKFTEGFRLYAIPSDTVRQVAAVPGLVQTVKYRPSLLSQIRRRRLGFDNSRNLLFASLVEPNQALPQTLSDAEVADAGIEYLQYRRMLLDETFPAAEETRLNELLAKRAEMDVPTKPNAYRLSSPPDQGHDSFAVSMGGGHAKRRGAFLNLWVRPAFHDFMARDVGYPPLSQIHLMESEWRFYTTGRRFSLHKLNLVDVISLTPIEQATRRLSWKGSLGVDVIRDLPEERGCDLERGDCRRVRANVGVGGALTSGHRLWDSEGKEIRKPVLTGYLFGELDASYADRYDRSYRIAPGTTLGLVFDLSSFTRFHASANALFPVLGDKAFSSTLKGEFRQAVARNWDLRASASWFRRDWESFAGFSAFF